MWKITFNFKINVIMNHSIYNEFAAQFAAASLTSLVESFNRQVQCRGFNSARAAYDMALVDELERRGIDLSDVSDGTVISFAHHVRLENNSLVTVD